MYYFCLMSTTMATSTPRVNQAIENSDKFNDFSDKINTAKSDEETSED